MITRALDRTKYVMFRIWLHCSCRACNDVAAMLVLTSVCLRQPQCLLSLQLALAAVLYHQHRCAGFGLLPRRCVQCSAALRCRRCRPDDGPDGAGQRSPASRYAREHVPLSQTFAKTSAASTRNDISSFMRQTQCAPFSDAGRSHVVTSGHVSQLSNAPQLPSICYIQIDPISPFSDWLIRDKCARVKSRQARCIACSASRSSHQHYSGRLRQHSAGALT